ncbi:MAG: hypothetical protein WCN85_14775, partial [Burkholderiales bacterium]
MKYTNVLIRDRASQPRLPHTRAGSRHPKQATAGHFDPVWCGFQKMRQLGQTRKSCCRSFRN